MTLHAAVLTPRAPGAIAVIHLTGEPDPLRDTLADLTGRSTWSPMRMHWCPLADIDDGLVGFLRDDLAVLMPHGGLRVVQRLLAALQNTGVMIHGPRDMDIRARYPEARSEREAALLDVLAQARSPRAVDVLLDHLNRADEEHRTPTPDDIAWSARIRHLIMPPLVVVAGPPNVGKSTLSNALMGREQSIAYDEPGTTRDYTSGLLNIDGVVVRWLDTPGLRISLDDIESRAIDIARRIMLDADLLIAVADSANDWAALPRTPDLRIGLRGDLGGRDDADIVVSAQTGENMNDLVKRVRRLLVTDDDFDADHWLVLDVTQVG